jgi:dephospho-CoA kinase
VARIVFDRPDERGWLQGVLWPRVGARIAEWREGLSELQPPPLAAVVEVPLLFESGMEAVFDRTLAVVADEEVRAERAGARGHERLEGRTSAQLTQEEKSQRADFTVRNDGTVSELEEKLSRLLEEL